MHARGGGKLRGRSRFLHEGKRFSGPHVLRRFQEIVERRDADDYRRQRRGNLRVHRIRPVIFTHSRGVRDRVFMYRGMEGLLHLARRAGKFDRVAPVRHMIDLKALRLQPRSNGLNILLGRSELLPELRGGQPLVIIR